MTPFDFIDYLDLADSLAAGSDEAAWRSAISRAYYAALHVAFQALPLSIRGTITHRTTHRDVWQLYTTSSVAACRQIGHAGIRLQRARVQADYRVLPTVSSTQTIRLVAQARQAIERIQRHGYRP